MKGSSREIGGGGGGGREEERGNCNRYKPTFPSLPSTMYSSCYLTKSRRVVNNVSCNFSQEGYAQAVQFLLDKGAVINAQDKNRRTGNVGMSFLFWILVFISKFYCYLVNSVADFNKMRGT